MTTYSYLGISKKSCVLPPKVSCLSKFQHFYKTPESLRTLHSRTTSPDSLKLSLHQEKVPLTLNTFPTLKNVMKIPPTRCQGWNGMFNHHSFNFPSGFVDAINIIKKNLIFLLITCVTAILVILFLCQLWLPIWITVFVMMIVAWLFLYFLSVDPLMIIGCKIDEHVVLLFLSVATIGLLMLVGVKLNIVVMALVGVVVVVVRKMICIGYVYPLKYDANLYVRALEQHNKKLKDRKK